MVIYWSVMFLYKLNPGRGGGVGFRCYGIVAMTLIGVILGGHNALNQAAVREGE